MVKPQATKGEATKAQILAAARRQFAARGKERATIRGIGAEARVDPALVLHYFGSKESLFAAATELPIDPQVLADRVLAGEPEGLAGRMLAYALELWSDERTGESLKAIIRSALADSAGAEQVANAVSERLIVPLGAATGRPDGELRTALAFSQGIGLAIARHLLGIRQLVETPDDELLPLVEPNLRRYLSGDLEVDPR